MKSKQRSQRFVGRVHIFCNVNMEPEDLSCRLQEPSLSFFSPPKKLKRLLLVVHTIDRLVESEAHHAQRPVDAVCLTRKVWLSSHRKCGQVILHCMTASQVPTAQRCFERSRVQKSRSFLKRRA